MTTSPCEQIRMNITSDAVASVHAHHTLNQRPLEHRIVGTESWNRREWKGRLGEWKDRKDRGRAEGKGQERAECLDGLADVDQTAFDGVVEAVEAAHLLHEHSVHALLVARRVLAKRGVDVERCRRQLRQDVARHVEQYLVLRLPCPRAALRLHNTEAGVT